MAKPSTPTDATQGRRARAREKADPKWVTNLVGAEPRAPLMLPLMAYLLLMTLNDALPTRMQPLSIALHIGLASWVTWLFRHHTPPLGRLHLGPAIAVGLFAAWLWVAGQHWLDGVVVWGHPLGESLSVSRRPPFVTLEQAELTNPHDDFGDGVLYWSHVILKICRAVTIVPIVEELFWRGFILRAFVSWDHFDRVPWGKFTLVSFVGSSLLSVVQHPGNWGVSIVCWMLFNGLFYWKRSLRCLMVTHAVTNLALYIYVVRSGAWQFW